MCVQYLDLSKTYVHWRQGQPQAAAVEDAHDDASDLTDEEGVDVGLDSGAQCLPPPCHRAHTLAPQSAVKNAPLIWQHKQDICRPCVSCDNKTRGLYSQSDRKRPHARMLTLADAGLQRTGRK